MTKSEKTTVDENEMTKLMAKPLVKVSSLLRTLLIKIYCIDSSAFQRHALIINSCFSTLKYSDMPTEMGGEAVEIITMALDKFQSNRNYEVSKKIVIVNKNMRFRWSQLF